ncbi:MAG: hypothetical protein WBO46_23440, partial [Caldilineaceae bacterium]
HQAWVAGAAFTPDGQYLLSAGGDGAVCGWRGTDGDAGLRQELDAAFSRMAASADGWLAVGDEDGSVRMLAYPQNSTKENEQ